MSYRLLLLNTKMEGRGNPYTECRSHRGLLDETNLHPYILVNAHCVHSTYYVYSIQTYLMATVKGVTISVVYTRDRVSNDFPRSCSTQ